MKGISVGKELRPNYARRDGNDHDFPVTPSLRVTVDIEVTSYYQSSCPKLGSRELLLGPSLCKLGVLERPRVKRIGTLLLLPWTRCPINIYWCTDITNQLCVTKSGKSQWDCLIDSDLLNIPFLGTNQVPRRPTVRGLRTTTVDEP